MDGARSIGLFGVDHGRLMIERPDAKAVRQGYRPHPHFNAGDVAEALGRLMFH